MSWYKPVLEGGKLLLDLIKLVKPKGKKPGPDVQPIRPEDLKKKSP